MCFIEEEDDVQEVKEKPEAVALPVWMGMRFWDNSDLREFMSQFSWSRQFVSYNVQELCDVDVRQMYGKRYLSGIRNLLREIRQILDSADTKVAIFYIVNGTVAESNWFPILRKLVAKHAPGHSAYTVVFGGSFENMGRLWRDAKKDNPYDPYEIRSHQLGAVYSSFDSDAPTAGMKRLMEMMNRIMGADLPDKKFPNFSEDELRQLAWHVCRENFNSMSVRKGAIPKYQIGENGRPVFNVGKL